MSAESLVFLRRVREFVVVQNNVKTVLSVKHDQPSVWASTSVNGALLESRRFIVEAETSSEQSTSVRVAFPDPVWLEQLDQYKRSFPVFTFLPVTNAGLPFMVQGDFELTSNREDIHEGESRFEYFFGVVLAAYLGGLLK